MIPGFVVMIATFPGVIVHEMAHQLFCRLYRVAVFKVVYFRLGNPAGYVVHELPRTPTQHVMIALGPFLLNSIVGALVAAPGVIPVLKFDSYGPLDVVLVWLGVSIAMHAFPSTGDAKGMWHAAKDPSASMVLKVVTFPLIALIYAGALGSVFWLDLGYGVAISYAVPTLLVKAMGA